MNGLRLFPLLFVGWATLLAGCLYVHVPDYQGSIGVNPSGHVQPSEATYQGSVAVAELLFAGQPLDTETVTISTDVYEWDSDATCCTGGNIDTDIAGSAELSLGNLVAQINASGTELVRADKRSAIALTLQSADSAGGTAAAADPNIALTEASTNVSWIPDNVNINTLSGQALAVESRSCAELAVTTALVSNSDTVFFQFDFTPTGFDVQVRDTNGVLKQNVSDQWSIAGNRILWTSAGATHVANTDSVTICVWE